jgi:hypothetical protein
MRGPAMRGPAMRDDKSGWIKVKNHPESKAVDDFQEPYVYCLLTSSKIFRIGETIYSDWDDIDEDVLEKLVKNCPYLPDNFKSADIHPLLDNGLSGDSQVELFDGSFKNFKDIQVNEQLKNGELVVGTVKIDGLDLQVGKYCIADRLIICSKNSTFFAKSANEMGPNAQQSVNTFELLDLPLDSAEPYLYQLLTTSGSFEVNGLMCKDYNYGIDKYILFNTF